MDSAAHLVWRGGVEVRLTEREYEFPRPLVLHRSKVVTHQQIPRELWVP